MLLKHVLDKLDFREVPAEEQWKICVSAAQRSELLRRYHDELSARHLGIAKTIRRIASSSFWPRMMRDIVRYVRKCLNCLVHKMAQRRPTRLLHARTVDAPWTQMSVDFVGHLLRTASGYHWLLVCQD